MFPVVPVKGLHRRYLLVALVAMALCPMAHAATSRYDRVVQALESADSEVRAGFASSALLELTEVYLAEADLARSEAVDADDPQRLTAWSRAVERYAGQLSLVIDDINLGFPVDVRRHPREVASVSVAGRTIMLAHPRNGQQSVYEQSVLEHFCGQGLCQDLVAAGAETNPIPMSPGRVSPVWEFTAAGPRCSHQNLQLVFPGGGNLGRQRALCQQLMEEAESLATELAWQLRHGVNVDWQSLTIRAVALRPEHLVTLNTAGDSLLVSLPLLYTTPGLLGQLLPWLRLRYQGEEGLPAVRLEAAALGWE